MNTLLLFFNTLLRIAISLLIISGLSCKKYLDAKSDKTLQIPTSLSDLQALLDNEGLLNGGKGITFDETSADDYFVRDDIFNAMTEEDRNAYIWANHNYENYPNDWAWVYDVVNIANVVLDEIDNIPITSQNQNDWNNVKGMALFHRAFSLFKGATTFCKAYDVQTAITDLGMVLRLTSDLTVKSERASVRETYDRIIKDLKESLQLLPDLSIHPVRPAKASVAALLARTYLSMRSYDSCLKYASWSLSLKNDLIDYNTVDTEAFFPFERYNKEVLFHVTNGGMNHFIASPFYANVDSGLYNSFDEADVRKQAFFIPQSLFMPQATGISFKGMYYDDNFRFFIGLAVDEVYLMRSECYARAGNLESACKDLNDLMITRWKPGTFVPFTAATPEEALALIITERRKQLMFRGIRWMDIKRLNKEGRNITLKRTVNGQTYLLPPNDNRYALSLPVDIIRMTGMKQNPL